MKYYKLKYRLNMSHSANNQREMEHHHVLEIELYAYPQGENFVEFGDMEHFVCGCLDRYQNQYLNDCPEFEGDVSLENIGEVLYRELEENFTLHNWNFDRFEISETPLRIYIITKSTYLRGMV